MPEKLPSITKFNIRVYGLLFNNKNELLVSDEVIRGKYFTKFPGGGLEYNESTIECLKREFREELNHEIEVKSHFYTTDQFIRSAFRKHEQVICIYYLVQSMEAQNFKTSSTKFNFDLSHNEDQESFRWCAIPELNPDDFSFLSDSTTVELIKGGAN